MTRSAFLRSLAFAVCDLVLAAQPAAATPRFKAVAFDYFVVFDPNSVVP